MGNFYSKEQLERAKSIDLVYFLQARGEMLKRAGSEYKWIYRDGSGEHDSVMVRGSKWYDHKNQQGGDPIGFLQEFMGLSFQDAVADLLYGEQAEQVIISVKQKLTLPQQKKDFHLPEPSENMRKLFAYLIKTRFIDKAVVQHFVHTKSIYQEKTHDNIVFVGLDKSGTARSGQKKSTNTYLAGFKATISGSETEVGFGHHGNGKKLFVFEAPVDLMSYITIYPEKWQEESYIALDGLSPRAIFYCLEENKAIEEINICVDYDEAGIEAAGKMKDLLLAKGYKKINRLYPVYKDWNEMLKAEAGITPTPAQKHPLSEAYQRTISCLDRASKRTENSYVKWRMEQFQKHGLQFACAALSSEYNNWKQSVEYGKITQICSNTAHRHLMRMADICLMAQTVCSTEQKQNSRYLFVYKHTLQNLGNHYTPHTDKGKLKGRCQDLDELFATLQKAMIRPAETATLKLALSDFADYCIRTKGYLETKYSCDLAQQQALICRNDDIKLIIAQQENSIINESVHLA